MSTWQEIRETILTILDVRATASTDSELRRAVDVKILQARNRLYSIRYPDSLITLSDPVTVSPTTTYIALTGASSPPLTPSFVLTDFGKLITITVEDEDWEYRDFITWVREKSANAGNQRWYRSFTLDKNDRIYLRVLPPTGETWEARALYGSTPATIIDGGTPEIGDEFEELLLTDVVIGFPNRFITEERIALLAQMTKRNSDLLMLYKSQSRVGKLSMRYKPSVRNLGARSLVNWGQGDL